MNVFMKNYFGEIPVKGLVLRNVGWWFDKWVKFKAIRIYFNKTHVMSRFDIVNYWCRMVIVSCFHPWEFFDALFALKNKKIINIWVYVITLSTLKILYNNSLLYI